MRALRQQLLVLLVIFSAANAAPDLPAPATGAARDIWDKALNAAWLTAKPHVAFCLGEKEAGVLKAVLDSFPNPLPTEPAGDPVCSNATELGKHLCGPKSLMQYYKVCTLLPAKSDGPAFATLNIDGQGVSFVCPLQYLLLTDNDEKVPNTAACPAGVSSPECSPGMQFRIPDCMAR